MGKFDQNYSEFGFEKPSTPTST